MSVSKSKLHLNCLILTAVILILLPFLTGFDITRRITIEVDGQRKELRTNTATPQQILKDAGVVLNPGDGWRGFKGYWHFLS